MHIPRIICVTPNTLLIVLAILSGCQRQHGGFDEGEYQIKIDTNSYVLQLDHSTSNYEPASQYLPDWKGKESFAFLNRKANELEIYNLASGQMVDSLRFESDGPDGVVRIHDCFINNKDSIFFLMPDMPTV